MILVTDDTVKLALETLSLAKEVWNIQPDGTFVNKMSRSDWNTRWNSGDQLTPYAFHGHLTDVTSRQTNNIKPNNPEFWKPKEHANTDRTKTERPVGGSPNSITRSALRQLVREVYLGGITDGWNQSGRIDAAEVGLTDEEADVFVRRLTNNTTEKNG